MKIGLCQMNTQDDKARNLEMAETAIDQLAAQGADLVVLPEMFNFLGLDEDKIINAEPIPGPSIDRLQQKAKEKKIFLHCGSILEKEGDRIFNATVVFNREGKRVAFYRKIHLFDVEIPGGIVYKESAVVTPGREIVTFDCEGVTVGLSICYDLRFPELYRSLVDRGALLILIPAAFTLMTGKDHWEPLIRARAIENVCYVAACGQWGSHPVGNQCYGHSMVVNPWGTVLAQARDGVTTVFAELDFDYLHEVRAKLPALQHRRRDIFGDFSQVK
jgi:predicted amidohydrolase